MQLDDRTADGVAVLRLAHGKANAFSPAMVGALDALVGELAAAPPRALIMTGRGKFFSAGLDLPALVELDRAAMTAFMRDFEATMQRLYTLPCPVIAAINGHAIAGGCVLALQADVRIAADDPAIKIGLNEVVLGLGLPPHVLESLRAQVPAASLVPIALEGLLLAPGDARTLGLLDETVAPAALEAHALRRARALMAGTPTAFAQIKGALRAPVIAAGRAAEGELERWLGTWFSDEGRAAIAAAVERLRPTSRA
jgi:enoyl-CoA hydratase